MCSHDVTERQTWKINTFSADSLSSHISTLIGCQVWSGLVWAHNGPRSGCCFLLLLLMDVADGLFRHGKSVLLCYLLKQHLPPTSPAPTSLLDFTSSPPLPLFPLWHLTIISCRLRTNKYSKFNKMVAKNILWERKTWDTSTSGCVFCVF